MGDIRKNTFEEIWNGETYRRFRRKMFQRDYEEVCRNCSVLTSNPYFKP
jgi:radical SAM protein with 4Fe4S-binding SPASM domain